MARRSVTACVVACCPPWTALRPPPSRSRGGRANAKIEGVQHEFTSAPGVVEDVTDIVLNIKGLVFAPFAGGEEATATLSAQGPCVVTGADLEVPTEFRLINPEHVIATLSEGAQLRTLHFADLAAQHGMPCKTVSYGATPTFMNHVKLLPGITELRPGTYALMDASQGHAIGTLDRCAATVLASVISKRTATRTILDVGAKGLTMQSRTEGICATPGKGTIDGSEDVHIEKVFDEHAILNNKAFHDSVQVGDKVRILPVHICPVCNLYETAYLIDGDEVVGELPIACRGKLQ